MKSSEHWKKLARFFQTLENPPRLRHPSEGGDANKVPAMEGTEGVGNSAFTLIELLTVIGIIGILAAILFPVLGTARASADQAKCTSNLRQLQCANVLYASDKGYYVAAAEDICDSSNRKRWHGERSAQKEPFDGQKSPLLPYLGDAKEIKMCPAFRRYSDDSAIAFENGCGGYGYNDRGVGSRAYQVGYNPGGVARGMAPSAIREPAQTVMFCDAAYPKSVKGSRYVIEYSFAEAYKQIADNGPRETDVADPSIHFRHNGRANVVWCDGHVSREAMTRSKGKAFEDQNIGWFGPQDNTLFDPF